MEKNLNIQLLVHKIIKNNLKDLHSYYFGEFQGVGEDRVVAPFVGVPFASLY